MQHSNNFAKVKENAIFFIFWIELLKKLLDFLEFMQKKIKLQTL